MSARALRLPAFLRERLVELAMAALPEEACGLLLGRAAEVLEVLATRNCAPERHRAFEVHPEDHLGAHLRARARGLEVLGAWHSHPGGEAVPSGADRAGAPQAGWSLVVGLGTGEAVRAWCLSGGAMVEAPLSP